MSDTPTPTLFPAPRAQQFCSQCAHPITLLIPPDDNRQRAVCMHCGAVHYQNPRMVVGTLPIWQDQVLLCKRAIEPRLGYWTLPAGFMELGETTRQGAMRETQEEAGAEASLGGLFSIVDVPIADQVHFFYLAQLAHTEFNPGPESLDVRLFYEHEIPWKEIAFKTVSMSLRCYFDDKKAGHFNTHTLSIDLPKVNH